MSIDYYFERGLDRADKGFMCVSDARRQLWFSVVVFGICVALFLYNLSTISSPRNEITHRGGAGVQQPQLMLWKEAANNTSVSLPTTATHKDSKRRGRAATNTVLGLFLVNSVARKMNC